ncbi:MAG: AAA family ATPase [Lachnospiraceae bacterium]|nr:AAA family ATPase [Lachnospiraceae bacterium]
MARDYLNMDQIYKDFFGTAEGENGHPAQGTGSTAPAAAPQTDDQKESVSAEEALAHAQDALREAKALFGENVKEEPAKKEEPEEDPMEQLNRLIGLDSIKKDVTELMDFVKMQQLRKEQGLKSVPVSLHLVFTGNPGTGKTTVARIIAKLYKQIGVLKEGQLIEVDRSGLVAGYVGQTAIKTTEQIEKAIGGVLFIDEAYSLAKKDDAFGEEAIDTILKAMEDRRDEFVVIVAGYTKPMEKFINSNPGLKSRFNKYIEFPDYSVDELQAIFEMNCKKYDYRIDEDAKKHIRELITAKKLERAENFANAREVRNLFESIITNQAHRLAAAENPSAEDLMTILMEDLQITEQTEADSALIAALEEKTETESRV